MSTQATDFAQPIYMQEDPGAAAQSVASVSNAATTAAGPATVVDFAEPTVTDSSEGAISTGVDPNDPRLTSEDLEINYEADAYSAPPPPPDGRYRVKLKQIDVNGANGEKVRYAPRSQKNGIGFGTALELSIQDASGKYDGIKAFDYQVNTIANPKKNNAIPVVHILRCLRVALPQKMSPKSLMDTFLKATAGEPELEVELAWEGQVDKATGDRYKAAGKYAPSVLGQHRFPQNPDKSYQTHTTIKVNDFGSEETLNLTARIRVMGYYPLKG